jgi:hypothetical protein
MSGYEWLASVKAGDDVVVRRGWGHGTYSLVPVARVTDTQIVTTEHGRERRYRRRDGALIGNTSKWERWALEPATEERRRSIALSEARSALKYADWERVSDETVLEVRALLSRAGQAQEPPR